MSRSNERMSTEELVELARPYDYYGWRTDSIDPHYAASPLVATIVFREAESTAIREIAQVVVARCDCLARTDSKPAHTIEVQGPRDN